MAIGLDTAPDNLTYGVYPVSCHSHNDYRRRVPLLQAVSAGCPSVEADLWLNKDASDILVGHSKMSLRKDYTLRSLYVDPITKMLQRQNSQNNIDIDITTDSVNAAGIFSARPEVSLVLLLDLKSNGTALWPVIQQQLQPLREHGWLTFWNSSTSSITHRPITVVLSGDAPFDLITANSSHRDIFYDAPLDDVENDKYSAENSYYASASFRKALHYKGFSAIKDGQRDTLRRQVDAASRKELVSRYWDTPSWPVSLRNDIWKTLVSEGVGVLNVDDVVGATWWNWRWCLSAGFGVCK